MNHDTKETFTDVSIALGAELLVVVVLFCALVLNSSSIGNVIAGWVG